MKSIYIILVFVFIGCATSTKVKSKSQTLKITNIEEFDKLFGIDAINTKTNEKIFIVSRKQSYWEENNLKKPILNSSTTLIEGNSYSFKLRPIRPIVGKVQGLGAYIIVENDTLKSAESYEKLPLSFISENSIGLLVSN
jgi:hypothetical protein